MSTTEPNHAGTDRPTVRRYSSPLRERQARQTRELILDAVTNLLDQHAADEATTKAIAQAAGVSERTVYRHFPDRHALLEGLSERIIRLAEPTILDADPASVDDLANLAVALMRGLDEQPTLARAEALLNADPRRFTAATRSHSDQFHTIIAAALPDLDERDRLRVTAAIRCLLSSQAWLRMREEYGIPGSESGPVVAWVIGAVFNEIERGNPPPPRGPTPAA